MKSTEEVNNEIKEILYELLSAEDSEVYKEDFETIYDNFITFYEDMHNKVENKDERNKKRLYSYMRMTKKRNTLLI